MGHPDGAHTHGSGGSGLGEVIVVIVAVALLGPAAAAAVAALLHALLIAAAVILGLALTGVAALVAWRLRGGRQKPALMVHRAPPVTRRAAQPLPAAQRPAIERPGEVHLHFHGVDAAEVAAILADVNRDRG